MSDTLVGMIMGVDEPVSIQITEIGRPVWAVELRAAINELSALIERLNGLHEEFVRVLYEEPLSADEKRAAIERLLNR